MKAERQAKRVATAYMTMQFLVFGYDTLKPALA